MNTDPRDADAPESTPETSPESTPEATPEATRTSTLESSRPAPATLADCDREPIHVPGAIQSHGALLAFDPVSGTVLHASTNLAQWLPVGHLPDTCRLMVDFVGEDAYRKIGIAARGISGRLVRHEVVELAARPEAGQPVALEAVVHSHRDICIAELEPAPKPDDQRDWLQLFGDTIDALRGTDGLGDLTERLVQRVKRLTGLDRAMVYRFDPEWNGQVIAEAHEPGMESFLGLHYPASDIPAQARELYRSNLVRYIADVDYEPVPVTPWIDNQRLQPLDMSHSMLRSISPLHIQYLRNMGVQSTLTISLMVDGRLWGLISCHHRTATQLPLRLRRACHALSITASYMLGWHEQVEREAVLASQRHAKNRIVEAFNQVQAPLAAVVESSGSGLLRLAGAIGGLFWRGDERYPFGQWPAGVRGDSILRSVRHTFDTSNERILCSEQLSLQPPLQPAELRTVCGLMAIKLDDFVASGFVWLRPELRREVAWGGNPDKPVQVQTDARGQVVLSPRTSFARWDTLVSGRCRAWSDLDREAARALDSLGQVLTLRDSLAQVSLSDRHFRSLVALQSDVYWQLDAGGRIVTLSRPLPTGHGAVQDHTLVAMFEPCCDSASLAVLRAALASTRSFRGLRLTGVSQSDARPFEVVLNGEPMRDRDGSQVGWHGTVSDLTHEVAVQSALRQKEAAELSSLAKSRFLSQISHELRTPLNAVLGFSQLLLSDGAATEAQRDQVLHIKRAGDWLLAMISDLMDLSQIETGNLSFDMMVPVDAREVLAGTVDLLAQQAAASEVKLNGVDAGAPVWVKADATRLKQVMVNLASNALKYNRTDGAVNFELKTDLAERRVRIEVHDTGVGLTVQQVSQLFQPFNRLGRERQRIQGTGIGLVIARQIVEAMGGRIGVDSEPGRGSCFAVTLDMADAPRADTGSPKPGLASSEPVVLYVEDEPTNVVLMQAVVEMLPGVRFEHAGTAELGLARVRELQPAVLLTDINLPGLPGTWLLREVKADPALRHIHCVAVTADALDETLAALRAAGFDDCWTKPINLSDVAVALRAALSL